MYATNMTSEEYKQWRKETEKFEKKFKKIIPNPCNLVQESLDKVVHYWFNDPIRDRWIINLANYSASQYYTDNNRYQPIIDAKVKNGLVTVEELKEYIEKFAPNTTKGVDMIEDLVIIYHKTSKKAHENKVANRLNSESDEISEKVKQLYTK